MINTLPIYYNVNDWDCGSLEQFCSRCGDSFLGDHGILSLELRVTSVRLAAFLFELDGLLRLLRKLSL